MIPKPVEMPKGAQRGTRQMTGASAYHTRDAERAAVRQENERARKAEYETRRTRSSRTIPVSERRVIAWDGEGVKLTGNRRPQHYVLFGCSADPENPLQITEPKGDLDFFQLADYIVSIGERFPNAIHVGYFFKYDHNMIIKSLPWPMKAALYEKNACRVKNGLYTYRIRWIPGKSITISRQLTGNPKAKRVRVTIDDLGPFFARSFVRAYESTFALDDRGPEWSVVVEGKQMRADTTWEDMEQIQHYWTAEIVALERLAVWFRDLMVGAGFPLTKWYGPGALANLLRRRHSLGDHEWGGKVQNLPPEVHDASKRAYFGGHVEQYQAGRITGPIYVLDINSAYPAAFGSLPSLAEGGRWEYREASVRDLVNEPPRTLSVWQARWMMGKGRTAAPMNPQPLPHRDRNREITYPPMATGWYWQPELEAAVRAALLHKRGTLEVFGGWEWHPANDDRPWAFMEEMYEHRARLKAMGNPMEMAFKLGMNSLYGKAAQRAGWNTDTHEPPRSHTLPLAGYVTAFCRGAIMQMIQRIMDIDELGVIAVETDGIFTTVNPEWLGVESSKELGAWSVDVYDELMYIQNGVYALRSGERWAKVKTRGMSAGSVSPEGLADYLRSLKAGERWEPMTLAQGEVFIGLGSAISRATTTKGQIAWPKAAMLHCRWEPQNKNVVPGVRGKRIHIPDACPACLDGVNTFARAHPLRVRSTAINGAESYPYQLPWEPAYQETVYEQMDRQSTWEELEENT